MSTGLEYTMIGLQFAGVLLLLILKYQVYPGVLVPFMLIAGPLIAVLGPLALCYLASSKPSSDEDVLGTFIVIVAVLSMLAVLVLKAVIDVVWPV